jgi:hypothetical protein
MKMAYISGLFAMVFLSTPVLAAHVYLDPEPTRYNRLDTFYVPLRIDVVDECINAVRAVIAYDPSEVSVRDVATGRSILTLWTETPLVERVDGKETGKVILEGGIPGGYCGRVSGDPGLTNILAELVVTGVSKDGEEGTENIARFIIDPSTSVYEHDGLGTPAQRTLLGTEVTLVHSTEPPVDAWVADITTDTQAPEYFDIILVPGPSAGNEYSYIVFSTTDKQSGVDHYEVREMDPNQFGFLSWVGRPSYWIPAESPYVLRDQRLHSTIQVKAVDKKGNERIVEYTPPMSPLVRYTTPSMVVLVVGLVVLTTLTLLSLLYVTRLTRRRQKEPTGSLPEEHHDA